MSPALLLAAQVSVAKPLLIYSLSAAADIGTTEYVLARNPYAREANPLLQTRGRRLARGVMAVAGATALDVVLQKKAPRWRWIPRVVIPAVSVGIAIHNWRQR